MKNTDSLSMTIRKVTDNIETLMNGGMLQDTIDGEITDNNINIEDSNGSNYTLEEFAELIEYIEPKTAKEIDLENTIASMRKRIEELEETSTSSADVEPKNRKSRVVLSEAKKLELCNFYTANKPGMTDYEIAAKFNVSSNYMTKIVISYGRKIPNKRTLKVTDG